MKRLLKKTRSFADAFRRSGGLRPALMKCWRLYRREGFAGVRAKLTSLHRQSMDYTEWICRYDTLTDEARNMIQGRIKRFSYKPLISVVMPTYNTNRKWLVEAIESVRKQLYPHWELCVADDGSLEPHVRHVL